MADWHLAELDHALTQAGWKIISQLPGDERKVSATWTIQRNTNQLPLLIDFEGLTESECLPLSLAYACALRNFASISLYFGKKGEPWSHKLNEFTAALNRIEVEKESYT